MFDDSDVFVKTRPGAIEVKESRKGVLSWETRTLLILIDGRKNYGELKDSLYKSEIYKRSGGLEQYFKILMDLEYIRVVEEDDEIEARTVTEILELTDPVYEPLTRPKSKKRRYKSARSKPGKEEVASDSDVKASVKRRSRSKKKRWLDKIKNRLVRLIKQDSELDNVTELLSIVDRCETKVDLLLVIDKIQRSKRDKLSSELVRLRLVIEKKGAK